MQQMRACKSKTRISIYDRCSCKSKTRVGSSIVHRISRFVRRRILQEAIINSRYDALCKIWNFQYLAFICIGVFVYCTNFVSNLLQLIFINEKFIHKKNIKIEPHNDSRSSSKPISRLSTGLYNLVYFDK